MGEHISKENFLAVYGESHLHVLTPSLIKEAFRKTGIVPVDRTVFDPALLAPSKESSHQVATPVIPPTPVRLVSELLLDLAPLNTIDEDTTPPDSPTPARPKPLPVFANRGRIALNELQGTSAGSLFTSSPIKSSLAPPDMPLATISPQKKPKPDDFIEGLLQRKTKTKLEQELQQALEEERARSRYWKTRTIHLQSTLVLQQVYCRRVRSQLKAKESKGGKKTNRKLRNPGLGRVITDDVFFNELKEQKEADEREERKKEQRKTADERCAEAVVAWNIAEAKRLEENEKRKEDWEQAKVDWRKEKEARARGIKVKDWIVTHPEPKRTDPRYRNIPKAPKPTPQQFRDEEEGEWEDTDENEEQGEINESETDEA